MILQYYLKINHEQSINMSHYYNVCTVGGLMYAL